MFSKKIGMLMLATMLTIPSWGLAAGTDQRFENLLENLKPDQLQVLQKLNVERKQKIAQRIAESYSHVAAFKGSNNQDFESFQSAEQKKAKEDIKKINADYLDRAEKLLK
jgi:hypothetical protein